MPKYKKNNIIIHISPSDIRIDSRILKEMNAVSQINNFQVIGIGVENKEGIVNFPETHLDVRTIKLNSRYIPYIPRILRHFITYIETIFKLFLPTLRLKPAIIHCHDVHFLPICVILKMICRSKLIYDAHELESERNGLPKNIAKIVLFTEKISWSKIDLLVTVSPSIIEWYSTNIGRKNSVLVLNSPVLPTPNMQNEERNEYFREHFNISKDRKIYLYLGYLMAGRGIDLYIDVFKDRDVTSHIVFMGGGSEVEKVKMVAEEYKNIHYHEPVPHTDIVRISRSADVGMCMIEAISLSDYYCLPNKLFEYAFSGLYVLASDFPDMKKVIIEFGLGKCVDLSKESIKSAVIEMESEPILKSRDNLYPLSWQHQAEKLVAEYQKII